MSVWLSRRKINNWCNIYSKTITGKTRTTEEGDVSCFFFVDLEKEFDMVPREIIRWALMRQQVPERLISMVMALCENTSSRVKTSSGTSGKFGISVGAQQGLALSPLLFMEEATRGEQRGLWELLYTDDLVTTAETRAEANN